MRINRRWIALAAVVAVAAGCNERGVTSAGERAGAMPNAPRRTVGPTATVSVACPTKLERGTTGPCLAFGYDAAGKYASSTVTSWASSNTSVATVSGGTVTAVAVGSATISATINGHTGSTTVTVAPQLAVTIDGSSPVKPNASCAYWATVSGGTAPYSYSWSQSAGSGSGYLSDYQATSSVAYTLTLTVTDANGATGIGIKNVAISSTAPNCLQ